MKLKIIKTLYTIFLNENVITWLVVINCILTFLMSFKTLHTQQTLIKLDVGLTIIFAIEMCVKLKVYGKHFFKKGWYDIPNEIATHTTPFIGLLTKYLISAIVLIGGMFGMSFVNSVFVDEMAVDNNDEVLREIKELKELINKNLKNK